jgi:AAHS family 4-hydroxybenzoate transporter-like MFS transporter
VNAILLLVLINSVVQMDHFILSAVSVKVQETFGLSNFQVGLLLSSAVLGMLAGAPIFGVLGDRGSRVRLMTIGLLVFGVSTLGSSFAGSLLLLVAARFLLGFGESAITTNATPFIRQRSTHEVQSNKRLALFNLTFPLGAAGGFSSADLWRRRLLGSSPF